MVLWIYFTLGFIIVFSPLYGAAYFFSADHRIAFQKLNHRFLKGLLWLMHSLVPGLTIDIDKRIPGLRSCVVISNHRSYLDPLILVTAFEKQATIVKSDFFRWPVFGWIIKSSGYIPSDAGGNLGSLLIERIKEMNDYLTGGGVLFVFPEGTRRQNGRIGPFNKGAFKIARRCNAPVEIVCLANTDKLFMPGRFFFSTCIENRIEARWIGRISSEDVRRLPLDDLIARAQRIMENNVGCHQGSQQIYSNDPNEPI